jgi:hypothetical protein
VGDTGGQGVAGSNLVVPTAGKDPLTLGESPGQWVFFISGVEGGTRAGAALFAVLRD